LIASPGELARFLPVEANTGTGAVNIFVRQDSNVWNLAVFNYSTNGVSQIVDLARAGLPGGRLTVTNLWDGSTNLVSNSLSVSLAARQSKLFQLTPYQLPQPVINGIVISNGNLILSCSNGFAGAGCNIQVTTNIASPSPKWSVLTTNAFDGSGSFQATNALAPGVTQSFYRLLTQ